MKRVIVMVGIIAQLIISQAANATSFTDETKYWAGWDSSSAYQNSKDVLEAPQITGGSYDVANDMLSSISFAADPAWTGGGWGTATSGDLFINVKTSADDHIWDYIVRTYDPTRKLESVAGNYALYDISSLNASDQRSAYGANSNPNMGYGTIGPYVTAYYRQNQPVAIIDSLLAGLTPVGTVYFDGLIADQFNTKYTFTNPLLVGDSWSFSWTQTCGNEVVQNPVPEPGTMMLLGVGLLGLVVCGKRRMNKNV